MTELHIIIGIFITLLFLIFVIYQISVWTDNKLFWREYKSMSAKDGKQFNEDLDTILNDAFPLIVEHLEKTKNE